MSNESKGPTSKPRPDVVVVQTTVQVTLTLPQLYALRMAAETIRKVDSLYNESEHPDIETLWTLYAYAANIDFVDDIAAAVNEDISELAKFINKGALRGQ